MLRSIRMLGQSERSLDRTMIHVNPSKVQTRRACNRCHQAKLKCVVDNGRKCQRCKRANTDCTFSPPSRGQLQQAHPRSPLPTSPNRMDDQFNWLSENFNWEFPVDDGFLSTVEFESGAQPGNETVVSDLYPTPMNASNSSTHSHSSSGNELCVTTALSNNRLSSSSGAIAVSTEIFATSQGSRMPSFPAPSGPLNEAPNSATSGMSSTFHDEAQQHSELSDDPVIWALKITPILAQLTQHVQSLPRLQVDDCTNGGRLGTVPSPSRTHNSDHTFDLSESFINVLSAMCSTLPTSQGSEAREGILKDALRFDEVSYLLVCATYLRFLEMHDTVFCYLLACLSHKREGPTTRSCFYLPKLIIGSFPLAMASETRPLLFVNLMESMVARAKSHFDYLSSISADVGFTSFHGRTTGSTSVVEPAFALKAVQEKEDAISTLIERVKTILSRPRPMK
jgi:hypothetical protein